MQNFSWNPVFNEVMRLKEAYTSLNLTNNVPPICDPDGFKTCIDRWIAATNDTFWSEVRPFLNIKQYKNAVLFKYGNLAMLSDLAESMGMSTSDELWGAWNYFLTYCRSITIDVAREIILTAPFDKFFNIDELQITSWDRVKTLMNKATNIEFSNKLDGSICIARYVPEDLDFMVTSSGSLNESEENATVLRDIKRMFFSAENEALRNFIKDHRDYTCMFEYIAVDNPIVVRYKKEDEGLYLIGMRNVYTGAMCNYKTLQLVADRYQIKVTSVFKGSLDDVMEVIRTKKSDEMEGFVINIDGQLFKLKTDDYVQVHKILSRLSAPNVIVQAIADEIYDDLLAKVPEPYRPEIKKVSKIIYEWVEYMENRTAEYFAIAPKEDKKTFMVWVNDNVPADIQGAVRNLYLGRTNNFLRRERGAGNYQYTRMSQIDPEYMDKIGAWGEEE